MSFWKSLFGGGKAASDGPAQQPAGETVEYNGYLIRAAPLKEGGKFLTAGTIVKEVGGVRKEHNFVRADSHGSFDEASSFSITKARQIIDLQGDRMFDA